MTVQFKKQIILPNSSTIGFLSKVCHRQANHQSSIWLSMSTKRSKMEKRASSLSSRATCHEWSILTETAGRTSYMEVQETIYKTSRNIPQNMRVEIMPGIKCHPSIQYIEQPKMTNTILLLHQNGKTQVAICPKTKYRRSKCMIQLFHRSQMKAQTSVQA